jgi:hypothetical protein
MEVLPCKESRLVVKSELDFEDAMRIDGKFNQNYETTPSSRTRMCPQPFEWSRADSALGSP